MPITDERMTRFWITLEQGVDFVLSSFEMMVGGEIYVPKIPSMKTIDLADALAPNIPKRIVGIRPGEKIHEVLITKDDARHTLELEDRFVIQPAFGFWQKDNSPIYGSQVVADGFSYSSDSNTEYLTTELLHQMCGIYTDR